MTRDQQKRMNAMCGDLERQVTWFLKDGTATKLHKDDWRRTFSGKELDEVYIRDPEEPTRLVTLAASSRRLTDEQASNVIERIFAFGNAMGVRWTDPEEQAAMATYEAQP